MARPHLDSHEVAQPGGGPLQVDAVAGPANRVLLRVRHDELALDCTGGVRGDGVGGGVVKRRGKPALRIEQARESVHEGGERRVPGGVYLGKSG